MGGTGGGGGYWSGGGGATGAGGGGVTGERRNYCFTRVRGVIGRKEGSSPSRPALLLIRPDLMLDYCTEGLGGTEIYGYRVGGWGGVGGRVHGVRC